MNIALAALATVVGQAQFSLQKNPVKRARNVETFVRSVQTSIHICEIEEAQTSAQREAAQKSDPIRKLN